MEHTIMKSNTGSWATLSLNYDVKKFDQDGEELTPQEYFDKMKSLKQTITNEQLDKVYENCLELANKYKVTGQLRGLRKILFCMETIAKERQLVDLGITTFVYKDDIDFYIDNVARNNNKTRPIKIIEVYRYEREIPDEIVDVIATVKDIFDELYIVYTDYSKKTERQIQAEKKNKDPILFGAFKNDKDRVTADRFYYLGDWIDEFCDLTLEKMVNETSKLGRNIERTISTPDDIETLKQYVDAHIEVQNGTLTTVVRKADKDTVKEEPKTFFGRVKTIFGK